MPLLSARNIKRTYGYLKRNGLKAAIDAAMEETSAVIKEDYDYIPPSESELTRQRELSAFKGGGLKFSIVVPAYNTDPGFFRELIVSCLDQTYPYFELIIADASTEDNVKNIVEGFTADPATAQSAKRIKYFRLPENLGISGNTNRAIERAKGDYIVFLDHDDLLTPDALYEVAAAIAREEEKTDERPVMLYSDEDKYDPDGDGFFGVSRKPEFDREMILTNNYICHLLVTETAITRELGGLRSEYDGAQDYDIILRIWKSTLLDKKPWYHKSAIVHIPKVLYHWRLSSTSTAGNPSSKLYAYENGGKAIEDCVKALEWDAEVVPLPHLGFYELRYGPDLFNDRHDIGAVGGRVFSRKLVGKNLTIGGLMDSDGNVIYKDLPEGDSGYMHRAILARSAEAIDIRCMRVRKELWPLYIEIVGREPGEDLPESADPIELSLKFCKAVKKMGYDLLYYPRWRVYKRIQNRKTGSDTEEQ